MIAMVSIYLVNTWCNGWHGHGYYPCICYSSDHASGWCVYNDIAVTIAHVLRATEAKILFLGFDAHHGSGVQHAFYDDPRVMTIMLHESGRTLFPGTGDVLEPGQGLGRG